MIDGVLEGTLSAAFVDGPLSHPELEGMPVYREEMLVTPAGHAEYPKATQVSERRRVCSFAPAVLPAVIWRLVPCRPRHGRIHEVESYHGMLACVDCWGRHYADARSMLESMRPSSGGVAAGGKTGAGSPPSVATGR